MKQIALLAGVTLLALAALYEPSQADPAAVVAACGTQNDPVGSTRGPYQDQTGELCTNASGGGGGGAAVYGPNANGVAASHPPIIIGGTDGTGTGAVQNAKVETNGSVDVQVTSSVAPTGVATSANQTSQITQETAIAGSTATIAAAVGSSIPAGSALIGKVGVDQTTPGTTNGVSLVPVTVGGTTSYGLQSAASTNSTNVKNAAGVVTAMNLINTTTTIYYLRMYNSSSAPTCSSATGFVRTWPIPPAAASGGAGGIAVNLGAYGSSFSTGIGFCLTGGPSSTDNTNAATGVFVNLDYK